MNAITAPPLTFQFSKALAACSLGLFLVSGLVIPEVLADESSPSVIIAGTGDDGPGDAESYSGFSIQVRTDDLLGEMAYGDDYVKAAGIGKVPLGESGAYVKGGLGHLERDFYLGSTSKGVTQNSYGLALGLGNDVLNGEIGFIYADTERTTFGTTHVIDPGNANTYYGELIWRTSVFGHQLDVAGSVRDTGIGQKNFTDGRASLGFYPTANQSVMGVYDSTAGIEQFTAEIGIQFTWGGSKTELSPYAAFNYHSGDHWQTTYEYRKGKSKDPLSLKNMFESAIATDSFVAQELLTSSEFAASMASSNNAPTLNLVTTSPNGTLKGDVFGQGVDYTLDNLRTLRLDASGSTDTECTVVTLTIESDQRGTLHNGAALLYDVVGGTEFSTETFTLTIHDCDGATSIETVKIFWE